MHADGSVWYAFQSQVASVYRSSTAKVKVIETNSAAGLSVPKGVIDDMFVEQMLCAKSDGYTMLISGGVQGVFAR